MQFWRICRVLFETIGSKGTQAELEMCKCSQYAYVAALFFFTKIEVSYRKAQRERRLSWKCANVPSMLMWQLFFSLQKLRFRIESK